MKRQNIVVHDSLGILRQQISAMQRSLVNLMLTVDAMEDSLKGKASSVDTRRKKQRKTMRGGGVATNVRLDRGKRARDAVRKEIIETLSPYYTREDCVNTIRRSVPEMLYPEQCARKILLELAGKGVLQMKDELTFRIANLDLLET